MDVPEFSFAGRKLWARVVSVYDGDTMTVVFPVEEKPWRFNVRLYGIDTCEMKSKDAANKDLAVRARNRVIELVAGVKLGDQAGKKEIVKVFETAEHKVWLECLEFDKYGRVLVKVYRTPEDAQCINDVLVHEKLAYAYFGETKDASRLTAAA